MGKSRRSPSFDFASWEAEFAQCLELELLHWQPRLACDTIRALAIECLPWDGNALLVSLLTEREAKPSAMVPGNWDTAAWRLFRFPSSPSSPWPLGEPVISQMRAGWEKVAKYDKRGSGAGERLAEELSRCCVRAIRSPQAQAALRRLRLASDFRVLVRHGDDRERNFFEETAAE